MQKNLANQQFLYFICPVKYLENEHTDPHLNMALDEYLLQDSGFDEPLFCLWRNSPSVIIGLNQSAFSEVNLKYLKDNDIKLARRVTGGGAVYHDLQNLNYTISGRSRNLERDYPDYVHAVADALRRLGVPAQTNGRNDITVEGRKCSGYAKRVYKDRLLVHGTLMFNVDIQALTNALAVPGSKVQSSGIESVKSRVANLKDYFPESFTVTDLKAHLQEILAGRDAAVNLDAGVWDGIFRMKEEKFGTDGWIYGKSPATAVTRTEKFACGSISANFDIVKGKIRNLSFGGDFIGNENADFLAAALEGAGILDSHGIAARISKAGGAAKFFDGLDDESLGKFIIGL